MVGLKRQRNQWSNGDVTVTLPAQKTTVVLLFFDGGLVDWTTAAIFSALSGFSAPVPVPVAPRLTMSSHGRSPSASGGAQGRDCLDPMAALARLQHRVVGGT